MRHAARYVDKNGAGSGSRRWADLVGRGPSVQDAAVLRGCWSAAVIGLFARVARSTVEVDLSRSCGTSGGSLS